MTEGAKVFISGAIATVLLVLLIRRPRLNRGQWAGILAAIVIGCGLVFYIDKAAADSKPKAEWFYGGRLYLGLDYTNHYSPFCLEQDKLNSNLGAELYVYRTGDRRTTVAIPWTHHSGATCTDQRTYDAIGIRYSYEFNFSDLFR